MYLYVYITLMITSKFYKSITQAITIIITIWIVFTYNQINISWYNLKPLNEKNLNYNTKNNHNNL